MCSSKCGVGGGSVERVCSDECGVGAGRCELTSEPALPSHHTSEPGSWPRHSPMYYYVDNTNKHAFKLYRERKRLFTYKINLQFKAKLNMA